MERAVNAQGRSSRLSLTAYRLWSLGYLPFLGIVSTTVVFRLRLASSIGMNRPVPASRAIFLTSTFAMVEFSLSATT